VAVWSPDSTHSIGFGERVGCLKAFDSRILTSDTPIDVRMVIYKVYGAGLEAG
jgi:hypothetical protein